MDSAVCEISSLVCAPAFLETRAKPPTAIAIPVIAFRRDGSKVGPADVVFKFITVLPHCPKWVPQCWPRSRRRFGRPNYIYELRSHQIRTRSGGARYSLAPGWTSNAEYHASMLRTVSARYCAGACGSVNTCWRSLASRTFDAQF